ncbi:unnamed protein product [Prorocentrum cordatum]|uniref:Uncharacterized protein n=1 Tax=Prorocentrum cordatum TaxID=2364126 RepID=A0ABN9S6T9_9DINO|nr:unnamed protein product [Polarella glacialis]
MCLRTAQNDARGHEQGQRRLNHLLVQFHGVFNTLDQHARTDCMMVVDMVGLEKVFPHSLGNRNGFLVLVDERVDPDHDAIRSFIGSHRMVNHFMNNSWASMCMPS